MASTCAVSMAMPAITSSSSVSQKKLTFFNPMPMNKSSSKAVAKARFQVKASLKEKAVTGLTAAALTASMVIPDVAEAADLSPSLKNFLLSIGAGGIVLVALLGAVIGVANFDPVKRT